MPGAEVAARLLMLALAPGSVTPVRRLRAAVFRVERIPQGPQFAPFSNISSFHFFCGYFRFVTLLLKGEQSLV